MRFGEPLAMRSQIATSGLIAFVLHIILSLSPHLLFQTSPKSVYSHLAHICATKKENHMKMSLRFALVATLVALFASMFSYANQPIGGPRPTTPSATSLSTVVSVNLSVHAL